jgi:hypothetical protein
MKTVAPGASDVIVISATLFKTVLLTGVESAPRVILPGKIDVSLAIFYTLFKANGKLFDNNENVKYYYGTQQRRRQSNEH